eukprot:CAMPEP_0201549590 /NCGR_PEP_ID=MMETSP0173_2-20130828/6050_1 /ASSEMBLY_ACC=CAM_ASM_000268 /TAXON_ID=218659 /ORGANISM="Vexillifera sp., Strain DIVA3 564/2" /LENGTH=237 /DNA_ID=CAMNT_0047959305 /DNA_START=89 /DNA_END=799 /DNA_ORIENTATION=+
MEVYRGKHYFVEFVDVGGSRTYERTRRIFFSPDKQSTYDGVMLVYDQTNKNSYNNLGKWVSEAFSGQREFNRERLHSASAHSKTSAVLAQEQQTAATCVLELIDSSNRAKPLPVIIFGCKADKNRSIASSSHLQPNFNDEMTGMYSIPINTHDPNAFQPGSVAKKSWDQFIQTVIANKFSSSSSSSSLSRGSPLATTSNGTTTTSTSPTHHLYSSSSTSNTSPWSNRLHSHRILIDT